MEVPVRPVVRERPAITSLRRAAQIARFVRVPGMPGAAKRRRIRVPK